MRVANSPFSILLLLLLLLPTRRGAEIPDSPLPRDAITHARASLAHGPDPPGGEERDWSAYVSPLFVGAHDVYDIRSFGTDVDYVSTPRAAVESVRRDAVD